MKKTHERRPFLQHETQNFNQFMGMQKRNIQLSTHCFLSICTIQTNKKNKKRF